MSDLLREFHKDMLNIYHRAKKEAGYNATRFLQMLTSPEQSLHTAKKFVLSTHASGGFTELWERKRLDLTVERLVAYTPKYEPLFTDDELASARARLKEASYSVEGI